MKLGDVEDVLQRRGTRRFGFGGLRRLLIVGDDTPDGSQNLFHRWLINLQARRPHSRIQIINAKNHILMNVLSILRKPKENKEGQN